MKDKIIETMAEAFKLTEEKAQMLSYWPRPEEYAEAMITALEQSGFRIVEKDEPRSEFAGVARNITECDEKGHDWVRDGQMARCARGDCDYVRMPQGDEREVNEP